MRYLSTVGLALSLVFGCLLLALVAELYYLLWWKKKRISNREFEENYSSPEREFLYMFCWKKPSSLGSTALNPQELCSSVRMAETQVHEPQSLLHAHPNKDFWLRQFEEDDVSEAEAMRLQNLSGPPRFLFTIKEETKEDLEAEDGRSRKHSRSRSLSDLILTVETPYLTPLASPPYFTPPLTPLGSSSHTQNGFNPLFESSTDAEFRRIRSSPPPKFKFLKDAEDKLYRRQLREAAENGVHKIDGSVQVQEERGDTAPSNSLFLKEEENGSFITLVVAKNRGKYLSPQPHNLSQCHSSSSQVLPLTSSPSTFRPPSNKKAILY